MTTGLLITNAGQAAIAADLAGGADLVLTHVAVGDANGVPYAPVAAQTALVAERYRMTIASVAVLANEIIVDAILPADTPDASARPSHGFNVHEIGLFSAGGTLIGVARMSGGYKPPPSTGQAAIAAYRLKLAVSNPSSITVVIDPQAQVILGRQVRPFWMTVDGVRNDPPAAPASGATYIVGPAPTGAWTGFAGRLAQWVGVWSLATAPEGHLVCDNSAPAVSNARFLRRSGAAWVSAALSETAAGIPDPAFVRSNAMIYRQATGTPNALVVTFAPPPANYAELRMLLVVAIAANTRSDVTIKVNDLPDRPIRRRGGGKLRRGEIQPGPILLIDSGTSYEIVGTGGTTRTLLQAPLDLYVATTGSDGNDGLDPAAPFATWQRAWSEIINNYDLNGYVVTVWGADGTYTAGVTATGAPLGASAGTGSVVFRSTSGNASACIVGSTNSNAFTAQAGAQFTVQDIKLQTAGANTSALVTTPGGLIAYKGVRFGQATLAHVNSANGGFIQPIGDYVIEGGAAFHAVGSGAGSVAVGAVNVTLVGTPNFSGAFAYAQQGRVSFVGTTWTGGATGSRFLAVENGVISTNGAGLSALPGNAAGSTATGGQYV